MAIVPKKIYIYIIIIETLLPSPPPLLADNVLAKCWADPGRKKSSKRRCGFAGKEVKPDRGLQVEKPCMKYKRTCCATPPTIQRGRKCVCLSSISNKISPVIKFISIYFSSLKIKMQL